MNCGRSVQQRREQGVDVRPHQIGEVDAGFEQVPELQRARESGRERQLIVRAPDHIIDFEQSGQQAQTRWIHSTFRREREEPAQIARAISAAMIPVSKRAADRARIELGLQEVVDAEEFVRHARHDTLKVKNLPRPGDRPQPSAQLARDGPPRHCLLVITGVDTNRWVRGPVVYACRVAQSRRSAP